MFPEDKKNLSSFDRLRRKAVYLKGTSAGIDPRNKTYIVLYWKSYDNAVGYNLYRRRENGRYGRAINGKVPIRMVQTCDELKAIIPEDSPEWTKLEQALTNLAGYRTQKSQKKTDAFIAEKYFGDETLPASLKFDARGLSLIERYPPAVLAKLKLIVDPCKIIERGLTEQEQGLFEILALTNLKFRQMCGLAYIDNRVTVNEKYLYRLTAVFKDGSDKILDNDFSIVAGKVTLPGKPGGFHLMAGDSRVLALWNENSYTFTYDLQRKQTTPFSPFQTIHEEPIVFDITEDLNGDDLENPCPGYLDYKRWDEEGLPISHDVSGISIDGPHNGITYEYRVACVDILGRKGLWSKTQQATPQWETPPMAPHGLEVHSSTSPPSIVLNWQKVTHDVDNHKISDAVQTYHIYRADSQDALDDLSSLSSFKVGSCNANPSVPATETLSWSDSDPQIFPKYGEKDFWYRIRCADMHQNLSAPSAAISGHIPDTTPPGPTKVTHGVGYADHITVHWLPNSEPDLGGYQIYRSICDKGKIYHPQEEDKRMTPCDVLLVGQVTLKEAQEIQKKGGDIYFDDYSLPAGSPLCYAYWVRAYDHAENIYEGDSGCPASDDEYICQRLYEETAPPAPIITALKARNNAVHIEWISSPLQDLKAFHVYRSEDEDGPLEFLGCVFLDGSIQSDPWEGVDRCACDDIPAVLSPDAITASFLDKKAKPHQVYWYRVSALDWLANESESDDLLNLPAVSTFSYSKDLPAVPVVKPTPSQTVEGCGLQVAWSPIFDPSKFMGFVVFRSTTQSGQYLQVSDIVEGNVFTDPSARRGTSYWYCVQAVGKDGKLSEASAAVRYQY